MRFGGQIRVPEVDHPGVPATFLVDENQAEVILEGESLGRWSLFDVQVDRLVSNAFQIDLAGEEITFLADEPVDFAYKGVEHMAEVWARYKTMTIARRLVAVRRSRKGTTPSRLAELHEAMVENLEEVQTSYRRTLAGETLETDSVTSGPQVAEPESVTEPEPEASPFADSPIEDRSEDLIPTVPLGGETTGDRADQLDVARTAAALEAEHQKATGALEAERLEGERLQAARLDMERLDAERRSLEQRHETERLETERLEAERKELKTLDAERVKRERAENERFEAQREELERLEADRIKREQIEAGRIEEERHELERVEVARAEATRLEMERLEAERKELERLEVKRLEAEKKELKRLEADKAELEAALALEAAAAEAAALEAAEAVAAEAAAVIEAEKAEALEAAKAAKAKAAEEDALEAAAFEAETQAKAEKDRIAKEDAKATDPVKEVIATSSDGEDPETAKELVVDLGEMEPDQPETPAHSPKPTGEPAMAATAAKSGLMGAVRSGFSRNGGKNHVHDFTEAPGGIGMVRYICRDCGFVSISSSD